MPALQVLAVIVFAPWSEPSGNGLPPAIARIVRLVERPLQARLANLLLESLPTFPPQQTMRLAARCEAIDFRTKGIDNNAFQLSDQLGNHGLLSLFRDADCPFCNLRVDELTHDHTHWLDQNLEVTAVFTESS